MRTSLTPLFALSSYLSLTDFSSPLHSRCSPLSGGLSISSPESSHILEIKHLSVVRIDSSSPLHSGFPPLPGGHSISSSPESSHPREQTPQCGAIRLLISTSSYISLSRHQFQATKLLSLRASTAHFVQSDATLKPTASYIFPAYHV